MPGEGRHRRPSPALRCKLGEPDGTDAPSLCARSFRGQIAIMIGPELTVLGVADAELPVSSETTMLL
jgi:hypothetical protein